MSIPDMELWAQPPSHGFLPSTGEHAPGQLIPEVQGNSRQATWFWIHSGPAPAPSPCRPRAQEIVLLGSGQAQLAWMTSGARVSPVSRTPRARASASVLSRASLAGTALTLIAERTRTRWPRACPTRRAGAPGGTTTKCAHAEGFHLARRDAPVGAAARGNPYRPA